MPSRNADRFLIRIQSGMRISFPVTRRHGAIDLISK